MLELELDESVTRADLALALASIRRRAMMLARMTLTVVIADEEPAEVQPLHETMILDFDATGRLQGCELVAAREFGLAERLARLEPFRVALEEETDPRRSSRMTSWTTSWMTSWTSRAERGYCRRRCICDDR